ncbi:hypothetical protein EYC80_009519 [Monilinia laxa]|uniref:Mediator of RNA polymerase II transcription subunit 7 n=1 Tax=Monilinia laxa TaxID=61186 RepID=A0A5N6JY26_MONLA|nr:hypothetical protein EYC80_009519 [Monilinia laxa]
MADQQQPPPPQPNQLAAAHPGPPSFWKHFTPDNIERIEKLRAEKSTNQKGADKPSYKLPPRILDLPVELRYLQPPEPPTSGSYRTLGQIHKIKDELPTLEESEVERLYTPPDTPTGTGTHGDRALILKRIAKSLLLNYLELVGIMSINPEQSHEKISDLNTLFVNFHHLLNEYRPHQARESLILMMQDQLDRSRAETEGIMKMKEKVEGLLESLGQINFADEEIVGCLGAVRPGIWLKDGCTADSRRLHASSLMVTYANHLRSNPETRLFDEGYLTRRLTIKNYNNVDTYNSNPHTNTASPNLKANQKPYEMCTSNSTGLVNRNGPGSAASSTISDIVKGTNTTGKTKCLECDGYECCCIPIPCTVM